MSNGSFGTLYHTQDGKTVFIDPNTNQATVFEGVKTIEQIMEPKDQVVAAPAGNDLPPLLKALMSQMPLVPGVNGKLDLFIMVPPAEVEEQDDILGPKDYFILVPKEKEGLLLMMPLGVHAWVSEYKKGHKPDYKGYSKVRILPEQWDWLMPHKTCSVVAWFDQDCPVFASVACQTHAKAMIPKLTPETVVASSMKPVFASSDSILVQPETVGAEEREV